MPRATDWHPSGVVTLLTDFGLADTYVGVLHGVLWSRARGLRAVVDLTHGVAAQDVAAASFHLAHAWAWFPPGTVHVAVVDPGVGSGRAILCARSGGHAFLAPDNGLLEPVLGADAEVFELDVDAVALPDRSATFHGRDVFAPAAARLASGDEPAALGAPRPDFRARPFPEPEPLPDGGYRGRVLVVDRFGNVISNLPAALVGAGGPRSVRLGEATVPVRGTYADAAPGEALALVDSYGLLEVAVRDGDAAAATGAQVGDAFVLLPPSPPAP